MRTKREIARVFVYAFALTALSTAHAAIINVPGDHSDLKDAVAAANANADPSNTIIVAPGSHPATYQVHVTKNLTIIGSGASTTSIVAVGNTVGTNEVTQSWIWVDGGANFTMKDLTLDGAGFVIHRGLRSTARTVVQRCVIKNITAQATGSPYMGMGVQVVDNNAFINDNVFVNFGRIGMHLYGPASTESVISGNTFYGKGNGDHLDYAIEVEGDATAEISHNSIFNCRGIASSDSSISSAILATRFFPEPGPENTTVHIHHNRFVGNTYGVIVMDFGNPGAVLTANYNNFTGNFGALYSGTSVMADTRFNWFSHKSGPEGYVPNGTGEWAGGNIDASGWLVACVNQFGMPVDLNGGYIMPNGDLAEAMTMPVGGNQVNESSGTIAAVDGTFTPFSDATKPPSMFSASLLGQSFEFIVELSGSLPENDGEWRIGATEDYLATTGGAYVRILRDSGAYAFQLRRWDGGDSGPLQVDTTNSSRFRVVVHVDGTGATSASVTAFDTLPVEPYSTNPTYSLGTVNSVIDDPAFFIVQSLGSGSPTKQTARMDVSCFATSAAPNAMYLFADDAYVKSTESISYRLGIANVPGHIAGYQAFLTNPTPGIQGALDARTYAGAPMELHILPVGLQADGSVDFFSWSGVHFQGTDARFWFDAPLADGVARLMIAADNGNPLVPTRISAEGGGAIVPTRYHSNFVVVDSVAPVLSGATATQSHGNVLNGANPTIQGPVKITIDATDVAGGSGLEGHPTIDIDFAPAGPGPEDVVGARMSALEGNTFCIEVEVLPTTPCGTATFTINVSDDANNAATPIVGTLNINTTQIDITVQLDGFFIGTSFTRGVHFWIGNAGLGTFVGKNVNFVDGTGVVSINALDDSNLPCGPGLGPNIAAKDPLHTITRSIALTHAGNGQYIASFIGSDALIGGDCWGPGGMPDDVIDILDFGKFASMFGMTLGPNTPLGTLPAHPDFSGDALGLVGTADYTFIQINFLKVGDPLPGGFLQDRKRPLRRATVKEMVNAKIEFAMEMDLNGDGWVTYEEIADWLAKRMGR
ncbi:MAG: right-handed parallel beta-helix repeat-containing protein [Fimbriimonadales bacterium]|nr:right-handed parallel beta-helix repeat-containing protein [Fimbriimonadales bacterium]